MFMVSVATPGIIKEMANSGNPWIYLAGILVAVIAYMLKKAYSYFVSREDRLIKLDEEHRKESKEREQKLMTQLESSTKSFNEITIVVNKISESQEEMLQTQRHLNNEFREMKNRMDKIEKESV